MPLSAFAQWTTAPIQPLAVSHQGQFPAVTISFNLAPGTSLGQATDAVGRAERDLQLPATISTSFQGTAQAFQQSLSTVPLLILSALVVVYLILGILYESYIHPITILSTLPSAGVGALATLGYAMVGGLIVSQALTLFTTPVIYLYLDQVSDWVASWRSGVPTAERPAASEGGSVTPVHR